MKLKKKKKLITFEVHTEWVPWQTPYFSSYFLENAQIWMNERRLCYMEHFYMYVRYPYVDIAFFSRLTFFFFYPPRAHTFLPLFL